MNKTTVASQPKMASAMRPAQSVLQRKCACGNHTVAGAECSECAKKQSNLQRKLAIGASNDPLEQEADRIADQVLSTPIRPHISKQQPQIRRYSQQATGDAGTAPASVDRVLASSGMPLGSALQQDMEQRFGHDFSRVRVHSGTVAEQSAQEVNAKAYTVGHNIVFGVNQFAPATHDGRRLIAHELTHVVQQSGGYPSSIAGRVPTTSLQRAVSVCEEYRAEDAGSATPGPGINVNVSRTGKRADVSARMQVSGTESDITKADAIRSTISSNWNGSFSDGYRIAANISVGYRAAGQSEDSNATQIELDRRASSSYTARRWLVGSQYTTLNLNESDALTWVVAHEFGHLLDLDDHYSEGFLSKLSNLFGGQRSATVEAGYQGNIMAESGGRLESRNVQELIARYTPYTCVRRHLEPL